VWWLTPVILATREVKISRIAIRGQSGQKVHETPSQPIKAGHGSTCLSSKLGRKCKQEDPGPDQPEHKFKTLLIRYIKQKWLVVLLKW
jgi:hypothetical protein